jgi:6,7-dimethyl-8-ribityllumazine synthase
VSGAGRPGTAAVDAPGLSLAIVATRWHQEITDSLVTRGIAAAAACGIPDPLVVRVPGAIELPVGTWPAGSLWSTSPGTTAHGAQHTLGHRSPAVFEEDNKIKKVADRVLSPIRQGNPGSPC